MNPESLVNQTIDRLISSYSDDILKEIIKKAEKKLKGENQYKIITVVELNNIFKDPEWNTHNKSTA